MADSLRPPARSLNLILGALAVILLPTLGSLGYFWMTKDPRARPLAMTREDARKTGDFTRLDIVARVAWVEDHADGHSQASLSDALYRAFLVKGIEDVHVVFAPGEEVTRITYEIGETTIGPFPVARSANGINAAVDALQLERRFQPEKP